MSLNDVETDLTVLMPFFNEPLAEETAHAVVAVLSERMECKWELWLLDDGSSGGVAEWARQMTQRDGRVSLWRFDTNAGKGAAINACLPRLAGRALVVIDADGEYCAQDIPAVAAPLLDNLADFVGGARYGFGRTRPRQYRVAYAANRVLSRWLAICMGVRLEDALTGLYGVRCAMLSGITLNEKRFSYSAELLCHLARKKARWTEVPVTYKFRTYSEGKKIAWWEFFTILFATWKYRPGRQAVAGE